MKMHCQNMHGEIVCVQGEYHEKNVAGIAFLFSSLFCRVLMTGFVWDRFGPVQFRSDRFSKP